MTVQQAIDYLNHKFPNVWKNETLDNKELLTMLWDFYNMGYEDGHNNGYEQGYDDGYSMRSEEWAMELSNKHLT